MNGSYLHHSRNTKEFSEGKNSAIQISFGKKDIINPYSSDTKEWLNWQLGFESIGIIVLPAEESSDELTSLLFNATLGYTDWNPMGFK